MSRAAMFIIKYLRKKAPFKDSNIWIENKKYVRYKSKFSIRQICVFYLNRYLKVCSKTVFSLLWHQETRIHVQMKTYLVHLSI